MHRIKIKNLKIKIISVIFALILWVYVVAQMQITGSDSNIVPLNYYNQTAGLEVSGPETVRITVWGAGNNTEFTAYVDLGGLSEGVYELPVQIIPSRGALLTRVEPDEVQVTIGSDSKKNMEISYEVMSQAPVGYELKNVILEPENCIVRGNEEAVAQVSRVVAQLYLGNVYEIQEQRVNLIAVNAAGEAVVDGVSIVPSEADATVLVEEVRGSKTVPITVSYSGEAADGHEIVSVDTNPRVVQIFGTYNQLENINEVSLGEIVISGQSTSFTRVIPITMDEDVTVYPSEVQVDVRIVENEPVQNNETPTNNENTSQDENQSDTEAEQNSEEE